MNAHVMVMEKDWKAVYRLTFSHEKEVGFPWRGDSPEHSCTPLIPVSLGLCTDLCNFETELTSTTVKIVSAEPQEH